MVMDDTAILHSERHRTNFLTNLLGYMGWFMVIIAIPIGATGTGRWIDVPILLAFGFALAGSHWFLAPKRYNVFDKELVIAYGRPRQKVIAFDDIEELEVRRHALGAEIRVHRRAAKSFSLQPWNPRRFHESLQDALNRHRGAG